MLFELKGLTKRFGGLVAVEDFDMDVGEKEIVGLIGPNGAGKTTVFNLATGVLKPNKGQVIFKGRDITGLPPHKIAELGIGRTFQNNPLFERFTVLENVIASFHVRPKSGVFATFFNTTSYRKNERFIFEKAWEILRFLGIENFAHERARNLPHGFRVMLGIARALAVSPELLLLDEPTSGMANQEIKLVLKTIERLIGEGVSIVLVEHNMDILDICQKVVVMNFGRKIAEGTVQEIRSNREVIEAYLGVSDAA